MLLITPSEVVENGFSTRETITSASIRPSKIDVAQEYFIRPIFGDTLFDEFLDGLHPEFVNSYLKPALAHYVRYGVISELSVSIGDNGAVVYQNEVAKSESKANGDIKDTLESSKIISKNQNIEGSLTDDTQIEKNLSSDINSSSSLNREIKDSSTITGTNEKALKGNLVRKIDDSKDGDREISSTAMQPTQTISTQRHNESQRGLHTDTQTDTTTTTDTQTQTKTDTQKDTQTDIQTKVDKVQDMSTKQQQQSRVTTTDESYTQNNKADKLSINTDESSTNRTLYRPSTDYQRQVIIQRALFDANVLLSKAVRYVVRNPGQFSSYAPVSSGILGFGRIVF